MAFHESTQHAFQQAIRVAIEDDEPQVAATPTSPAVEESQTWVLFSPATADTATTTSYLDSVHESQQTPGRSRISDLGSSNAPSRSDVNSQPVDLAVGHVLSDLMEEVPAEDDAELDMLDSHLPEFRSISNSHNPMQPSNTILPTHDGLGIFKLDNIGLASEMQEQMYAFERFNPRRVKRRRESFDLAQLEFENEEAQELERNRRIENWRLEQSKLLLDDIQKETRRRKLSGTSTQSTQSERNVAEAAATMNPLGATPDATTSGCEWHDQDPLQEAAHQDGVWSRLTRNFMREFMGIDGRMLEILFGEALPEDEDISPRPKSSARTVLAHPEAESQHDSSWQLRMLDRVARELGVLIHRISAHPGAFSTYTHVRQMPLPYAGLPIIPESAADVNEHAHGGIEASTPSMPQFQPTIKQIPPGAIPGRSVGSTREATADAGLGAHGTDTFTQQEWERDLDVKLVFKYLRSRFLPRPSTPTGSTAHLAPLSAQDTAAKVARVRQHHPLVGRARPAERRTSRATTQSGPVAIRYASSCASQSTRRSTRRSSVSSRHTSRHYWDIGGSGSMIASTGPMGSWGEV